MDSTLLIGPCTADNLKADWRTLAIGKEAENEWSTLVSDNPDLC